MYCKNCGMKMHKNFCTHCGLMDNGVFIDTKKPIKYKNTEFYLGKDFDKITRNENFLITGLLGPTYIICRGFLMPGVLLFLIDTFIAAIIFAISNAFFIESIIYPLVLLCDYTYLIINRIIWATITNLIYLNLLERKCVKLKKKHPNDYKEICRKKYNMDLFLIKTKYVVVGYILFMLFLIIVAYLLSFFGFRMPIL